MNDKNKSQNGQTIVWLALILVVLLGMTALAIDVGGAYATKRQLQNAADAGALAGARAFCEGSDAPAARSTAVNYAKDRNYAPTAVATASAEGVGGGRVHAITSANMETSFAKVVGIDTIDVSADAIASCGASPAACGLWPIAFPQSQWNQIASSCGKTFYVWGSYQDKDDDKDKGPDCNECECNTDGVPGDDIISEAGRAWLDFSSVAVQEDLFPADNCTKNGCGADELKCWLAADYDGRVSIPEAGLCVDGDSGVKAGVKKIVDDRKGDYVSIPLFDQTCTNHSGLCKEGYRIRKLACVRIDPVDPWQQQFDLDYKDGSKHCWKGKVIKVAVACGNECANNCGVTAGA
ncbi:MAG: pilus assembly protein, partial [Chloroflexi bacterium]|nr:pilus assembly protein [Chloroflexota bacterium]